MDAEQGPESLRDPHGKTFVLDLKVKIKRLSLDNRQYKEEMANIEVQTTDIRFFTDRIVAYLARMYSNQLKEGQAYQQLQAAHSLVFTTFPLRPRGPSKVDYVRKASLCFEDDGGPVTEGGGMLLTFVNLGQFVQDIGHLDEKGKWCYLLKHCTQMTKREFERLSQGSEVMGEAVRKLWELSEDEAALELMEAREKQRKDREGQLDLAEERGIEKGIVKGREEGREKIEKMVLSLSKEGVDLKIICKTSGLSPQEIQKNHF